MSGLFLKTPFEIFACLRRNRTLVARMAKREIQARYRGSLLGVLWAVISPLFLLGVYSFVFTVIFQSRWNVEGGSRGDFALYMFSGMIVFNVAADMLTRAPSLLLENVSYIKRVVFPLEILPWISLCSALFNACLSLAVFLAFYLVVLGLPPLGAVMALLVAPPLALFLLGGSWLLAALGLFVRDLTHVMGLFVMLLMFMSPIFYPVASVPERFRPYLMLNPLAAVIENARRPLFSGLPPDWSQVAILYAASLGAAWLGLYFFLRARKAFADVV